jgi:hypothetical protein
MNGLNFIIRALVLIVAVSARIGLLILAARPRFVKTIGDLPTPMTLDHVLSVENLDRGK